MHVTKIVRFDWSAVSESFWYKLITDTDTDTYLLTYLQETCTE